MSGVWNHNIIPNVMVVPHRENSHNSRQIPERFFPAHKSLQETLFSCYHDQATREYTKNKYMGKPDKYKLFRASKNLIHFKEPGICFTIREKLPSKFFPKKKNQYGNSIMPQDLDKWQMVDLLKSTFWYSRINKTTQARLVVFLFGRTKEHRSKNFPVLTNSELRNMFNRYHQSRDETGILHEEWYAQIFKGGWNLKMIEGQFLAFRSILHTAQAMINDYFLACPPSDYTIEGLIEVTNIAIYEGILSHRDPLSNYEIPYSSLTEMRKKVKKAFKHILRNRGFDDFEESHFSHISRLGFYGNFLQSRFEVFFSDPDFLTTMTNLFVLDDIIDHRAVGVFTHGECKQSMIALTRQKDLFGRYMTVKITTQDDFPELVPNIRLGTSILHLLIESQPLEPQIASVEDVNNYQAINLEAHAQIARSTELLIRSFHTKFTTNPKRRENILRFFEVADPGSIKFNVPSGRLDDLMNKDFFLVIPKSSYNDGLTVYAIHGDSFQDCLESYSSMKLQDTADFSHSKLRGGKIVHYHTLLEVLPDSTPIYDMETLKKNEEIGEEPTHMIKQQGNFATYLLNFAIDQYMKGDDYDLMRALVIRESCKGRSLSISKLFSYVIQYAAFTMINPFLKEDDKTRLGMKAKSHSYDSYTHQKVGIGAKEDKMICLDKDYYGSLYRFRPRGYERFLRIIGGVDLSCATDYPKGSRTCGMGMQFARYRHMPTGLIALSYELLTSTKRVFYYFDREKLHFVRTAGHSMGDIGSKPNLQNYPIVSLMNASFKRASSGYELFRYNNGDPKSKEYDDNLMTLIRAQYHCGDKLQNTNLKDFITLSEKPKTPPPSTTPLCKKMGYTEENRGLTWNLASVSSSRFQRPPSSTKPPRPSSKKKKKEFKKRFRRKRGKIGRFSRF